MTNHVLLLLEIVIANSEFPRRYLKVKVKLLTSACSRMLCPVRWVVQIIVLNDRILLSEDQGEKGMEDGAPAKMSFLQDERGWKAEEWMNQGRNSC